MKILRTCLLALIATIAGQGIVFVEPAVAGPEFGFNTHRTRLPYNYCMQDARRTVHELGLKIFVDVPYGLAFSNKDISASIICTFLPGAGPCAGTDGAVVTFTVAGPGAVAMLDRLVSTFGDGVLFDCG